MPVLPRFLSGGLAVGCSVVLALSFAPGAVARSATGAAPNTVAEDCVGPAGVTCVYDVAYGDGPSQTLDVYTPTGASGEASVLLIHGGGWTAGDSRSDSAIAGYFAQNGFAVYSLNYTLATEGHPSWPQVLADIEAASGWVSVHAADYGADGSRQAAVGDSAGAHLAALLNTAGREDGFPMLASVSWSGPMDMRLTYRDSGDYVRGAIEALLGCIPSDCRRTARAASPISYVASDDGAMLMFNSDEEIVPLSGVRAMQRRLKEAHVPERLVVFRNSDAHASQYLCFHATVLGKDSTVIDATLRWLGTYVNGAPLTPTGIC